MTETTPGSWQPDPYGRYAQRYWDGSAWTSAVSDGSGNQFTDPPEPTPSTAFGRPSPTATGPGPSGPPIPGLIAAAVGAVLLLLSLFVLNWYDFTSDTKSQISSSSDVFESVFGLSGSDLTDGIKLSELRTINDKAPESDISSASDQYLKWGWLVEIAGVAFVFAGLFVRMLRWPALVVALVLAAWHLYVVNDLGGTETSTQVGAWVGAIALVIAAVALVLPRPLATRT